MKKLLLIAVLIAACLSATAYVACVAAPLLGKNIKGSGKIVAKTVPAPDFDGIEASRAVKVVISDKVSDIRIEADDNLIDLVVVRAVKGKLEATLDQKVNNIQNGNVTITVPANGKIRSLDASSASKIIGETTLKAGKFSIEASSAAKIKAAVEAVSCTIETSSASKVEASIEAESCSLDASSASKIILEGSAGTFRADMSSASKLNAEKFSAVNATIDTSSAASASIDCSGKLTASASAARRSATRATARLRWKSRAAAASTNSEFRNDATTMKEVKKCSISGVAFTMDADAYEALETYLESLKTTYKDTADGAEIVADIEARIAELILSAQDNTRIVEKPLILNIIRQMGSAEDISRESVDRDLHCDTPRIPRRLYRDTENAKLGGVCAGIGKYFDIDPVWVRLGLFLPLLFTCFGWIPFLHWFSPMFGNLFGIFLICYFIMWFAVPAARSARQKLEMNGEKITAQSIGEVTAATATACAEPDAKAKPIVAEVVSVFGKVVLILLKIIAGFIVFGLIMAACALIIGMFALIVGGEGFFTPAVFGNTVSIWIASLGILATLIPIILLIYVLMCLIASRKPGGKTVLAIFLLWLASIIAVSCVAIRENVGDKFRTKRRVLEQVFQSEIVIDGDTTTLERLLEDYDDESVIEEGRKTLHISVPSKSIDITVDKKQGELRVNADGRKVSVKASETGDEASVTIRRETDAADSAKTTRGSAARSR